MRAFLYAREGETGAMAQEDCAVKLIIGLFFAKSRCLADGGDHLTIN
jgi:hypothetical protein